MNEDELGRTLGTALAAPELRVAPGAGAALRGRARRDRGRRAVLAATAAVAAVAVVLGVARWAPTPAPTAAPPPAGVTFLGTPFTVGPTPRDCTPDTGTKCAPRSEITVDEVRSLRAAAGTVQVALTYTDIATLYGVTTGGSGAALDVRIGSGPPLAAQLSAEGLLLPRGAAGAAAATIAALQPRPVGRVRTGAGSLEVPLELWSVDSATAGPCRSPTSRPGRLVVDLSGECLTLTGPGVRIRSATLEVAAPDADLPGWRVTLDLGPADAAALQAWTRSRVEKLVAFVLGGRKVASTPLVTAPLSTSWWITADDRAAAEALIARLRP